MCAMSKNMDKLTADNDQVTPEAVTVGFAHALLAGLNGAIPMDKDLNLANRYWAQHFETPWSDHQGESSSHRLSEFLRTLAEMGRQGPLLTRWNPVFKTEQATIEQYTAFISDFMQSILHHPRTYHDFVCQRQTLKPGHPMDIAIQHPLAIEYWTIYVSKAGKGQLILNDERITLSDASILVMPPGRSGIVQRWAKADTWTFDMLSLRSRASWLELLDWALVSDGAATLTLEDAALRHQIDTLINQLERTPYQRGDLAERLCHNLIEQLLIQLRMNCAGAAAQPALDPRLRITIDFLLNNYRENMNLASIAERVHLSGSRLNALFRAEFGCSVLSWRENIRLQKGRELLNNTSLRISAIADATGYDDPLYFSRKFRQHFGVAPRTFRQHQT